MYIWNILLFVVKYVYPASRLLLWIAMSKHTVHKRNKQNENSQLLYSPSLLLLRIWSHNPRPLVYIDIAIVQKLNGTVRHCIRKTAVHSWAVPSASVLAMVEYCTSMVCVTGLFATIQSTKVSVIILFATVQDLVEIGLSVYCNYISVLTIWTDSAPNLQQWNTFIGSAVHTLTVSSSYLQQCSTYRSRMLLSGYLLQVT